MSATCEDICDYIKENTDYDNFREYKIDNNYWYIDKLTFYYDPDEIITLINRMIVSDQKALFFLNSADKAYELYRRYSDRSMFVCSRHNSKFFDKVSEVKLARMLKLEKFDDQFLFTTTCMDAGINIKDPDLKNIVVDIRDIDSLIQCVGRKRIQNENDTFDLYIHAYSNQQLGGLKTKYSHELEMADFLRTHSVEEFAAKYKRAYDRSYIIYDVKIDGEDAFIKRINPLKYRKKSKDIYASMGGVSNNAVIERILADGCYKLVLCVDNDEHGNECRRKYSNVEQMVPVEGYKDWNEMLQVSTDNILITTRLT